MSIIAKLSFWIVKSTKETEKSLTAFEQVIMEALVKFQRDGHVEKLKTNITSESLPSDHEDLLAFLYNQIAHT
jgi:hypothetical protein